MIGYTSVGTHDLDRATAFYAELLGLLGAKVLFKNDPGLGWGVAPGKPMLAVLKPFDGQAATVGNGAMVALNASDPAQVQALHAKALALGGQDEGAPGERGKGFYGAYFRDPDGNKLAVFCMVKPQD